MAYWLPVGHPVRVTFGTLKAQLAALSGHAARQADVLVGGARMDRDPLVVMVWVVMVAVVLAAMAAEGEAPRGSGRSSGNGARA